MNLPQGTEWPAEGAAYLLQKEQIEGYFEPGYGWLAAGAFYLCSWEREYLDSPKDSSRVALEQVERFSSTPAYTRQYDDATQKEFDRAVAAARDGDDRAIAADLDVNCPAT